MQEVKTRIAPSPTGNLHIGTVRPALHNFLYAKRNGGKFVIRVEDTDKERNKPGAEENILEGLKWLGIEHDELYRQSERLAIHIGYLQKLIDADRAYISKEPSKKDPSQEAEVVRLRNPNKEITFNDVVRGDITFDTTELGDLVIARAINDPLYHFAVVADDHDMGITHVIRGEDHISNTPRQILIQEALELPRPIYTHLPLVLAPDRTKMSKRHGTVSINDFREQGYLKEALVNFTAFLGWNPGTEQELFTMDELIQAFSLEGVQKGGAVFNIEKLNWYNNEYLKQKDEAFTSEYITHALSDISAPKTALAEVLTCSKAAREDILERISTAKELQELAQAGEYDFYIENPTYEKDALIWKKDKPKEGEIPEEIYSVTRERLEKVLSILENIVEGSFLEVKVKEAVWPYAEEVGKGSILWPLRFALSGRDKSPDPFTLAEALGKTETLKRIDTAIGKLTT